MEALKLDQNKIRMDLIPPWVYHYYNAHMYPELKRSVNSLNFYTTMQIAKSGHFVELFETFCHFTTISDIGWGLTKGLEKYPDWNWIKIEPYRYLGAFERHLESCLVKKEEFDKEGGTHIVRAVTNLMFLCTLMTPAFLEDTLKYKKFHESMVKNNSVSEEDTKFSHWKVIRTYSNSDTSAKFVEKNK